MGMQSQSWAKEQAEQQTTIVVPKFHPLRTATTTTYYYYRVVRISPSIKLLGDQPHIASAMTGRLATSQEPLP